MNRQFLTRVKQQERVSSLSSGKCLTDVVQHRLNERLARTVGSSNSINASNHRLPINHQRAAHYSQDHIVSSELRRTFCTSYHSYLGQFPDRGNPLKNPVNVESQKSEVHSENGVDIPVEGSADDAVNSLTSTSNFSKEEKRRRSGEGFWKYGQPRRSEMISSRRNYVVCYDNNMKIPVWVAECLTYECLTGKTFVYVFLCCFLFIPFVRRFVYPFIHLFARSFSESVSK